MKRCEDCRHEAFHVDQITGAAVSVCGHPKKTYSVKEYERGRMFARCGPDAKNFEPKEATT